MAKEETVRVAATQGVDRDNTLQLGIGLIGRIFLEKIHLISLQYLQYVSRAVSNHSPWNAIRSTSSTIPIPSTIPITGESIHKTRSRIEINLN